MNNPATAIALLLLLVAAPAASAGHLQSESTGVDVRQYHAFVLTHIGSTGQVPVTAVTVDAPHTWQHVDGESMLEIRGNYQVQSGGVGGNGADFRVVWNGTALANCAWRIEGGTLTGGRFNPLVTIFCELPTFAHPGNYTVQVERTSVSGTPVTHSLTSITLHQQESVLMEISINTAYDLFVPVFWLAILWFFIWRMNAAGPRYTGALLGTVFAFAESLIPGGQLELRITGLALIFLGLMVVALLDRFGTRNGETE